MSVIVPTLNESALVASTLERLAAVLPPGGELIVADGGSSDETAAIAAEIARVVVAPRGRGPQMNAGARAAGGDVLLFLHADCRLEAGAIEEACAILRDPLVVAVGFTQRLEGRGIFFRVIECVANLRVGVFRSIYGDSGLALRRETFLGCSGFPDFPLFEDLGISSRLRRLGGRFVLAKGRIHVSTRRWEREGVLRRTLANGLLTLRYKAGADPRALALAYEGR